MHIILINKRLLFVQMVRIKITTVASSSGSRKRKKRDVSPSLDYGKFKDISDTVHYSYIQHRDFLVERPVELQKGELEEFNLEITRREWRQLAEPQRKFDPEIVREFYCNAMIEFDGVADKRSFVQGRWISYDRDKINELLDSPSPEVVEGSFCQYSQRI